MDCYPKKGQQVYLTMKSGAIYTGIFQGFNPAGGGKITLQNVKCCQRDNIKNLTVSPKYGMNRKFWVSKIDSIKISGENE